MPTPDGHRYAVGDEVTFDSTMWHNGRAGRISEGTIGIITKMGVTGDSAMVKAKGNLGKEGIAWTPCSHITPADPNAPRPRKLGEKPEGDEFLPLDDPRIQWIFHDMGAFADTNGYCRDYDKLAEKFGIPGRERAFTVKVTRGLVSLAFKVKARSQAEANRLAEIEFAQALAAAVEEQNRVEADSSA